MIAPRVGLVLRVLAWAVIALSPVVLALGCMEFFGAQYAGVNRWALFPSLVFSALLPAVSGGILLVLLSIDERIQSRGL